MSDILFRSYGLNDFFNHTDQKIKQKHNGFDKKQQLPCLVDDKLSAIKGNPLQS